jgi:hypothetical protein
MAKKPPGQSWEGFVEWTIRKAMGEGEFANLPGAGKPIPELEEPYREDWWLRSMLKREQLSVPCASLDIRRDVEKTLEGLVGLSSEVAVREAIRSLNARIAKINSSVIAGPGTCVALLDVESIVVRWRILNQKKN